MFNKIPKITNRNIIDNFSSLEDVVNYVRTEQRVEYNYILQARKAGKGTDEYEKIKLNNLPCVIINFNHHNYVNSTTITNPTGYLYFDIDNQNELPNLDYNFIAAYWKSLSNSGYSIIVKVNGLLPINLKESYQYVGNKLNLHYDINAISPDRLTVLSFDPMAYYNDNPYEFNLNYIENTHYNKEKNNLIGVNCNGYNFEKNTNKIRFNNLDEMIESVISSIIYNDEGYYDLGGDNKLEYTNTFFPPKIVEGKRNYTISMILHNLIALNPTVSKEQFFQIFKSVNQSLCVPPLENNELNAIFSKKFKNRKSINLESNATRRFLYDPELNLSGTQKRSLALTKINHDRVEKSKNKIRTAINNWDYNNNSKITITNLAKVTGMNKKTIQKYYSGIKRELVLCKNYLII